MRSTARVLVLVITVSFLMLMVPGIVAFADNMIAPGNIQENSLDATAQNQIQTISGSLMRYIQVIGAMAAVIVLALYGIQYIIASPQEKANLKSKAWAYLIGAILVFGGATLMVIIANALNSAFATK